MQKAMQNSAKTLLAHKLSLGHMIYMI